MNYEAFCFALGHTVIWGSLTLFCIGATFTLWYYLSAAVALWLARVLADRKRPGAGGCKVAYTRMFLWRTRALIRIVLDWRTVLHLSNTTVSNNYWEVDLTGFFPTVRIK